MILKLELELEFNPEEPFEGEIKEISREEMETFFTDDFEIKFFDHFGYKNFIRREGNDDCIFIDTNQDNYKLVVRWIKSS